MLTRHFYELSEVALALHDALRRGAGAEAVWWARELLLSEEDELLNLTVLQAWTVWLGAAAVSWLDAWTAACPAACPAADLGGCRRMTLVAEFAALRLGAGSGRRRPAQAFIMVARGFSDVADPERVATALETNDNFALYRYLGPEYAKSPTGLIEALSGYVETPELFDGFRGAIKTLKGQIQLKHLMAAAATQALCLPEWPAVLVLSPARLAEVATWLNEWEPHIGLRSGRIYKVDAGALPRKHKRGSLAYGSATALMKAGCRFWQSMLDLGDAPDGVAPDGLLPDGLLPDGMPETWTAEEQSLSHPVAAADAVAAEAVVRTIIKPDVRMRAIWGFTPALRKAWHAPLKKLFDGVGV